MKISTIQAETRRAEVPFGEERLIVDYYPARFTRKLQQELAERKRRVEEAEKTGETITEEESEAFADFVLKLLAGWDLTDDDGKPYPLTISSLVDDIGYLGMRRILDAILEDVNPN